MIRHSEIFIERPTAVVRICCYKEQESRAVTGKPHEVAENLDRCRVCTVQAVVCFVYDFIIYYKLSNGAAIKLCSVLPRFRYITAFVLETATFCTPHSYSTWNLGMLPLD